MNVDKQYSYTFMNDGTYVSPTLRRAYANILCDLPITHDPFDIHGIVGKFAKKNYLLEKSIKEYKSEGLDEISKHAGLFWFTNKMLKFLLFFIGPNRFANLSRFFVYISSFRQIKKLWKI